VATVALEGVGKIFADGTEALCDLDLSVADGELVVLVGPSGCGKSTALRLIAGLEAVTSGTVRIGGEAVNDRDPRARNTAMVFQNYALYPHMTVRANLEFPLRMGRMGRRARRRRAEETAELLGITDLLGRRPAALSGGQRQRAAMGRALVRDPAAFLMDEPLSNLDAKLRARIRGEIAALQRRTGATTLYVTHDQAEAMTLGQRVAVLRDGRLQQTATPADLYAAPANAFVAGFLGSPGMNLFRTALLRRGEGWALAFGGASLSLPAEAVPAAAGEGEPLLAGLRPEAFMPAASAPPERRLTLPLEAREYLGHEQLAYLRPSVTTMDPEAPAVPAAGESGPPLAARLAGELPLPEAGRVTVGVDTGAVRFFDLRGVAL
jgi:multiple sugar transport system ATP-binding protein